ncbi:MAG: hypothetical protein ABI602_01895 [Candidatus Saccharibacteria bacterium]
MTSNQMIKIKPLPLLLAVALVLLGSSSLLLLGHAGAVPTQAIVRFDTLKATTATGGRVCYKPLAVGTETSVKVTFPTTAATDYVVNATATNWTTTVTNLDAGQTAWPGIGTASLVAGKAVTFPSSDLTVGTLYCFNFAAASTLTTSSAGASETTQGTVITQAAGPTTIDTSTYSESIISNDQVVVSAIVPPSFVFVLSGNTDAFASNLSTASVIATAGRTVTVTTNAASGWIVWAKDLNSKSGSGALQSATAGNYQIGGVAPGSASRVPSVGTEDYGLDVAVTDAALGGTAVVDSFYDGAVGTKIGTPDPTRFRPIASANGTANGDIVTVKERATIAGQTPAANDYTDTLTLVGAGIF